MNVPSNVVQLTTDQVIPRLAQLGIEIKQFFLPIHEQIAHTRTGVYLSESYPFAERMDRRGPYPLSALVCLFKSKCALYRLPMKLSVARD